MQTQNSIDKGKKSRGSFSNADPLRFGKEGGPRGSICRILFDKETDPCILTLKKNLPIQLTEGKRGRIGFRESGERETPS